MNGEEVVNLGSIKSGSLSILRFTSFLAMAIRLRGKEVSHHGNGPLNYLLINIYLVSYYINARAGSDESQELQEHF